MRAHANHARRPQQGSSTAPVVAERLSLSSVKRGGSAPTRSRCAKAPARSSFHATDINALRGAIMMIAKSARSLLNKSAGAEKIAE
jgi:hypothetical protein